MTDPTDPIARLRAMIASGTGARLPDPAPPSAEPAAPPAEVVSFAAPVRTIDTAAPPPEDDAAQPHADIARLASRMTPGESLSPHLLRPRREPPSREHLGALAESFGFDLVWRELSVAELAPEDFPVVVVLDDGTSLIVEGREPGGDYRVTRRGDESKLPAAMLAARESGVVLGLKAKPLRVDSLIDSTQGESAAAASRLKPVRLVDMVVGLTTSDTRQPVRAAAAGRRGLEPPRRGAAAVHHGGLRPRHPAHGRGDPLALAIGVTIALGLDLALRWVRLRMHDAVAVSASVTLQARL